VKLRKMSIWQLLTVGNNDLKGSTTYYLKLSNFTFYITVAAKRNVRNGCEQIAQF
jgi:hypothetical protein